MLLYNKTTYMRSNPVFHKSLNATFYAPDWPGDRRTQRTRQPGPVWASTYRRPSQDGRLTRSAATGQGGFGPRRERGYTARRGLRTRKRPASPALLGPTEQTAPRAGPGTRADAAHVARGHPCRCFRLSSPRRQSRTRAREPATDELPPGSGRHRSGQARPVATAGLMGSGMQASRRDPSGRRK